MNRLSANRIFLIFCIAVAAVLLSVSAAVIAYSRLPDGAARYTLSHASLSRSGASGNVSSARVSYSDAASLFSGQTEDSLLGKASDAGLLLSVELSNIGSDFSGIVCLEAGRTPDADTLSAVCGTWVIPAEDLSYVDTSDIGYYKVPLIYGGKRKNCLLIITDTAAPELTLKPVTLWVGDDPSPAAFIDTLTDATRVNCMFVKKPDCTMEGETKAVVLATDRAGNTARAETVCQVVPDTEPPVISGAEDRKYYIGENVLYKSGVTAADNRDGDNVAVNVDISAVDPSAEGTYPVTYTATDRSGLTSSVTVKYTFVFTREDAVKHKLDALCETVISSIIKEGMDDRSKAKAIYDWTRKNIAYTGKSVKTSWYDCAYEGLSELKGDCYTYCCVCRILFDKVGMENMEVDRLPITKYPNTHHWWNLVKVDGEWYHIDASCQAADYTLFLVTTDELLRFSRQHDDSNLFDPEAYPKTP